MKEVRWEDSQSWTLTCVYFSVFLFINFLSFIFSDQINPNNRGESDTIHYPPLILSTSCSLLLSLHWWPPDQLPTTWLVCCCWYYWQVWGRWASWARRWLPTLSSVQQVSWAACLELVQSDCKHCTSPPTVSMCISILTTTHNSSEHIGLLEPPVSTLLASVEGLVVVDEVALLLRPDNINHWAESGVWLLLTVIRTRDCSVWPDQWKTQRSTERPTRLLWSKTLIKTPNPHIILIICTLCEESRDT